MSDTITIPKIDNSSPIYDSVVKDLGDPFAPDEELDTAIALYHDAKKDFRSFMENAYLESVEREAGSLLS